MSVTEYIFLLMLVSLAAVFGFVVLLVVSRIQDELRFFKREVRSWQNTVQTVTKIPYLDDDGR